jgi:hypothetical protein
VNPLEILEKLGGYGPVFFGVGFLAPLIAQSMDAASIPAPFGMGTLAFGLAVGVALGGVAKWRGSWV